MSSKARKVNDFTLEIDSRWGPCRYFGKDEYVGKSLHNYGEYNPDETEKILELAGNGLCLDIGANIGVISQALLATGHQVMAFEPQPEVFKLLEFNAAGAMVFNWAIGAEDEYVEMPIVSYSERGNFGGIGIGSKAAVNRGSYEVPVHAIDSLLIEDKISFIKIDVEGYELEVLKGATKTITRDKPVLYIEDDRPEKRSALRAYIRELGYNFEMHQPPLFRANNYFGNTKLVWDRQYASHNLICTPC